MRKLRFHGMISLLLMFLLLTGSVLPALGEETAEQGIQSGDILCFGEPNETDGFDGKWIVLDAEHTNMGTEGMFLVSLNLVGSETGDSVLFRDIEGVSVSFSDRGEAYAKDHPGMTAYQGSDIQTWCRTFYETHFSAAEQSAFLPTYRSDEAIVIPGFSIPLPGAGNGTVDFDPAPDVLTGDKVFLLSVEEAVNEDYGFLDNRSRVAFYKGVENGYWLRSPHIPTFPLDVGFVFPFGAVMDYPVNAKSIYEMTAYARPACNLDKEKITKLEKLTETDGKTVWKVTFSGEENTRVYDTSIPVVGEVMDLGRMVRIVFVIAVIVILGLIAFAVWLIIRVVRKRKNGNKKDNSN